MFESLKTTEETLLKPLTLKDFPKLGEVNSPRLAKTSKSKN